MRERERNYALADVIAESAGDSFGFRRPLAGVTVDLTLAGKPVGCNLKKGKLYVSKAGNLIDVIHRK
jgi:hypothetical protein